MNPLMEEALKEAYVLAPASVSHLHTLELRSGNMSEPLYLIQGFFHKQLKVDGEWKTFRACAFDFVLPATDEGGLQEMTLTFDNANNRVSDFCETAMEFPSPIQVLYRPYLSTDLETPQMNPPLRLFFLNATVSAAQVTGRCVPADFINAKFPNQLYDSKRFPRL